MPDVHANTSGLAWEPFSKKMWAELTSDWSKAKILSTLLVHNQKLDLPIGHKKQSVTWQKTLTIKLITSQPGYIYALAHKSRHKGNQSWI